MINQKITYPSFSFDWVIKSIPYFISYKKAFEVNEIDEIFCSIIDAQGGVINKLEFGELMGFNLSDDQSKGKYKDDAEEAVFNYYLHQLLDYDLIKEESGILKITELGKDSLSSKLKYKFYYSNVTIFENVTAQGESRTFSFKEVFDLKSLINQESSNNSKKIIEDSNLKIRLQYQLFEDNIFEGELLEIFECSSNIKYSTFKFSCQLILGNDDFITSFSLNGVEKKALNYLVSDIQNFSLKEELRHIGEFHQIINSDISIDTKIIAEFIDLWSWKDLSENKNIKWDETEIFKQFKNNGDGSVWKSISENAPIQIIKRVIDEYIDYWDWRKLTQRFNNDFILNTIDKFKWDFEVLSSKENDFVIELLSLKLYKDEDWDWHCLSQNLPNNYIIDNINELPWDYYIITTAKFDVFKTVFITDFESQLKNSWDWKYISEEININYLYQNISKLSSHVIWNIVLNRFFNDEGISKKCTSGNEFSQLLQSKLPENFSIAHQDYLWSIEVISFFDSLELINWETTSYSIGFDTNTSIEWRKDIFDNFSNKINSEQGFTNISSLINDKSLLFKSFNWDWEAISKNKSITSDSEFITQVINQPSALIERFIWSEIYPHFDITFWNNNISALEKNTDRTNNKSFWSQITKDEEVNFVLSNYHLSWDWSCITEKSSIDVIIESGEDENLISKWDWSIATRKFDKETILDYLEEFTPFWDWEYLIKDVFTLEIELNLQDGQLIRIASCLSTLGPTKKEIAWRVLTSAFPFKTLFNYIETASSIDAFDWDWDEISNNKHLPSDILSLDKYKNKFNWAVLSKNESIQSKFSYANWGLDRNGCHDNIVKYLKQFKEKWDWEILSHNIDLNGDRRLLKFFKNQNWDWSYLSEYGSFLTINERDRDNYLIRLLNQFTAIDFSLFSKRQDLTISSEVILSQKNNNWDWQVLSSNPKAKISSELLIQLSNKNWDWKSISERRDIDLNNETIIELIDQDWNWDFLSSHPSLSFSLDFISKVKSKPLDWQVVSRQTNFHPSIEILTETKNFDLDWTYLSKRLDLNPTKELLSRFENKWEWHNITRQSNIDFKDVGLILRFIDKWDWSYLCQEAGLTINEETLNLFKKYLDWDSISSNTNIDFSEDLIQKYKSFWNWNKLKRNNRILESLGNYVQDTIDHSPVLTFLDKIESQHSEWGGSIYHFSHIENAVEIIKNRKILSRNKAEIKADAAGNVVHRRKDAHEYARFYFRPHTPTQFYNEFLGKDEYSSYLTKHKDSNGFWHEEKKFYYPKSRNLGFPKCPTPIFFKFSLKEILHKERLNCYMGNGNMQTNNAILGKFETMVDKMFYNKLFMEFSPMEWEDYLRFSQQEFLVKNELQFIDLIDFEIICPSEEGKELLISLIGVENKDVFSKIITDENYYNNENPRVKVEFTDSELHINSEFNGAGYLSFYPNSQIDSTNIESGDIEKCDSDKLIFKSHLRLKNYNNGFRLTFTDESKREWFIHQAGVNKTQEEIKYPQSIEKLLLIFPEHQITYDTKVRHYKLKDHTNLVLNQFDLYFSDSFSEEEKIFFRFFLILHDIGKPIAYKKGDKSNQYKYSIDIVKDIWKKASFSENDLSIVLTLLRGDPVGEYFQGERDSKSLSNMLLESAEALKVNFHQLFRYFLIYYQCDIASYTEDAGGLKFLEHLFEYKKGEKVFDEEEKLIRLSQKHWNMYLELKKEIELCQ